MEVNDFDIDDKVSFVGSFGMGRCVTRYGFITSIENGMAKVDCGIRTHTLAVNRLKKALDERPISNRVKNK